MADEEVDFEPDVDMDAPAAAGSAGRKPRAAASEGLQTKGRGHKPGKGGNTDRATGGRAGDFDRLEPARPGGAVKSVEGYIIFVTGLHQEAAHDDVLDAFGVSDSVLNTATAVVLQLCACDALQRRKALVTML
jgi:hypothetical protein